MDYFSLNSIAINGQLLGMAQESFERSAKMNSDIRDFGFNPNPEIPDEPIKFNRILICSEKAKRLLAEAMKAELEYWNKEVKKIAAQDAPYGGLPCGDVMTNKI